MWIAPPVYIPSAAADNKNKPPVKENLIELESLIAYKSPPLVFFTEFYAIHFGTTKTVESGTQLGHYNDSVYTASYSSYAPGDN